jgi:hypothetical protein
LVEIIRIYLRHIEGDQANNHAIREELEEDGGAKDVLDLTGKTAQINTVNCKQN